MTQLQNPTNPEPYIFEKFTYTSSKHLPIPLKTCLGSNKLVPQVFEIDPLLYNQDYQKYSKMAKPYSLLMHTPQKRHLFRI